VLDPGVATTLLTASYDPGAGKPWPAFFTNSFLRIDPASQTAGDHRIGFAITGRKGEDLSWIDWRNIVLRKLDGSIDPASPDGRPGSAVTMTLHATPDHLPEHVRYHWDFGDQTAAVDVLDNPEVQHTYHTTGTFTVNAEGFDPATGQPLVKASARAAVHCGPTITDARDGQQYKTVCIGSQIWMAQNLDYDAPGSLCGAQYHCDVYGRLYDWATFMAGAASTDANPSGVRGVCPEGWHVPSITEFYQLYTAIGGKASGGGALKDTTTWNAPNTGATNSTGFTALAAGVWKPANAGPAFYSGTGTTAWFGSATDGHAIENKTFRVMGLDNASSGIDPNVVNDFDLMFDLLTDQTTMVSVRCVAD
jgi:uncharacterized protein (TIGR02145 family)